jgi:hypothetical protein
VEQCIHLENLPLTDRGDIMRDAITDRRYHHCDPGGASYTERERRSATRPAWVLVFDRRQRQRRRDHQTARVVWAQKGGYHANG